MVSHFVSILIPPGDNNTVIVLLLFALKIKWISNLDSLMISPQDSRGTCFLAISVRQVIETTPSELIVVLTVYPKNGGNIQVITNVLELLPGMTPEKMYVSKE